MSSTSYAVLAKARAKYGKFLTDRDYESLIVSQSVPEVMVYLKSHTRFAPVLSGVSERDVHRGMLESLLRQYQFNEFDSLCRYDTGNTAGFSHFFAEKSEVEQIIRFLILLNSNATEKFIFRYPAYLSKRIELDLNRIAGAHDYDEFLKALEGTSYHEILKEFKPDEKGRLPVSEIENRLYARVSEHLLTFINEQTSGGERRELSDLFRKFNDYSIVSRILRLKKYYQLPPEAVKATVMPEFGSMSPKLVDKLCEAESDGEVMQILHTTRYGKLYEKVDDARGREVGPAVQYRLAKKYLHFSDNPSVVMAAFMFLSETELMNVISLIEGVRYRLDPKHIRSLLIR